MKNKVGIKKTTQDLFGLETKIHKMITLTVILTIGQATRTKKLPNGTNKDKQVQLRCQSTADPYGEAV